MNSAEMIINTIRHHYDFLYIIFRHGIKVCLIARTSEML